MTLEKNKIPCVRYKRVKNSRNLKEKFEITLLKTRLISPNFVKEELTSETCAWAARQAEACSSIYDFQGLKNFIFEGIKMTNL